MAGATESPGVALEWDLSTMTSRESHMGGHVMSN